MTVTVPTPAERDTGTWPSVRSPRGSAGGASIVTVPIPLWASLAKE